MHDDDQEVQPLVIDTSTAAASQTDPADQTVSEAAGSVGVDARSAELSSTSESCPVLPAVLAAVSCSENCDEDDDRGDYDEPCERHPDESMSSDSQSTIGCSSKDLTGSVSAGDLSPGPGTSARCSKSRRKADRVRTSHFHRLSSNTLY